METEFIQHRRWMFVRHAPVFLAGALVFASAHATDTDSAGGGDPIGTMQPTLALHCGFASGGFFPGPGTGCAAGGGTMLAEIRLFAGSFVPAGFYPADGRLLPISQNTALFSILFTTYGGNGQSTFGLPDLRGRSIAGRGGRPGLTTRALGEKFGTEAVTLNLTGLPAHTHAGPGGSTGSTGAGIPVLTLQPTLALQPLMCSYVMSPDYASEIRLFAGTVEPDLSCDGRLLSVSAYPELFAALATHYGGDGVVDFGIPDLRSAVAAGAGAGPGLPPRFLGEHLGVESIALTPAELTSHAHMFASGSTGSAGAGQAFENHQPTLAIRFAIAFTGIFPSTDSPNHSEIPTIGEIRPFAGAGPLPSGWFYADGQILPIAPKKSCRRP